jgi:hypothetical protein
LHGGGKDAFMSYPTRFSRKATATNGSVDGGTRLMLDTRRPRGPEFMDVARLPCPLPTNKLAHIISSSPSLSQPRLFIKQTWPSLACSTKTTLVRLVSESYRLFFVTPPRQPSNASCRRPASLRMTQVPSILPHPWRSVLPSAYFHRTLLWLTLVFRLSF